MCSLNGAAHYYTFFEAAHKSMITGPIGQVIVLAIRRHETATTNMNWDVSILDNTIPQQWNSVWESQTLFSSQDKPHRHKSHVSTQCQSFTAAKSIINPFVEHGRHNLISSFVCRFPILLIRWNKSNPAEIRYLCAQQPLRSFWKLKSSVMDFLPTITHVKPFPSIKWKS